MPDLKEVKLADGITKVQVPVYDFKQTLRSLLTDKELMHGDNLLRTNFDKMTKRPAKAYDQVGPEEKTSDINMGSLYAKGVEMYAPSDAPIPANVDRVVPCPLTLFCDETHTDTHAGNCSTPILYTVAFLNTEARAKFASQQTMGYIPKITTGKGKSETSLIAYGKRNLIGSEGKRQRLKKLCPKQML